MRGNNDNKRNMGQSNSLSDHGGGDGNNSNRGAAPARRRRSESETETTLAAPGAAATLPRVEAGFLSTPTSSLHNPISSRNLGASASAAAAGGGANTSSRPFPLTNPAAAATSSSNSGTSTSNNSNSIMSNIRMNLNPLSPFHQRGTAGQSSSSSSRQTPQQRSQQHGGDEGYSLDDNANIRPVTNTAQKSMDMRSLDLDDILFYNNNDHHSAAAALSSPSQRQQPQLQQHQPRTRTNSALLLEEPPSLMSFTEGPELSEELLGPTANSDWTSSYNNSNNNNGATDRGRGGNIAARAGGGATSSSAVTPTSARISAASAPSADASVNTTHTSNTIPWYNDPNRRNSVCSEATGSTVSDFDDDGQGGIESGMLLFARTNAAEEIFYPLPSRNYEWMARSIESLILGHGFSRAPILQLIEDEEAEEAAAEFYAFRRRSTASTFGGGGGGYSRRRSSQGSFPGGRRGSLSLGGAGPLHGGTLANYYSRRRGQIPTDVDRSTSYYYDRRGSANGGAGGVPGMGGGGGPGGGGPQSAGNQGGRRGSLTNAHTPMYRRRSSLATTGGSIAGPDGDGTNNNRSGSGGRGNKGGPNVVLSVMARESTGKSCFARDLPATQCLRSMGGHALFHALDKPAAGMATEVAFLAAAIDTGDWTETQTIISRLAPRLVGDPMAAAAAAAAAAHGQTGGSVQDPNLPATAPKFYAGGGRTGLERDAFVQAGGVDVLLRVFREKSFVGQEMAYSYDARDLSPEIVATRLAQCWNEALVSLRELVYSIPSLVEDWKISDNGDFLPFLFTLLSHDSCFDSAAALIEEILALLTQSPQPQPSAEAEADGVGGAGGGAGGAGGGGPMFQPVGRLSPPKTFFLGNVPELYKLWAGFNCRQLAHFCRILALLIFEPEDRQLLESPAILKSLELLLLRRNRAVRAGRDSTVDMNQSILLGDETLMRRLLQLLCVMNFAPSLRRVTPYHVMAQYPFIGDTLVMLGLNELDQWREIDRQEALARKLYEEYDGTNDNAEDEDEGGNIIDGPDEEDEEDGEPCPKPLLGELGRVADMLEGLSEALGEPANQIGHIIHVISAAQQNGVIVGRSSNRFRNNRRGRRGRNNNNGRNNRNNNDGTGASSGAPPSAEDQETAAAALRLGGVPVDTATIQGLASVAGILTDQVLVRRLYQTSGDDGEDELGIGAGGSQGFDEDGNYVSRHLINTPDDAANSMQFNGMLLGPYQVEVLFVLCTLLGGRRKLDAQDMLKRLGLVPVLHDMFQRLPWYKQERGPNVDDENANIRGSEHGAGASNAAAPSDSQPNGIHGPGCECTPESALCIQYLRLLHNFCDRDCDNYTGRRLLLSDPERRFVFGSGQYPNRPEDQGLLSKIIQAFIEEPDDSPYRFWLASCIESYLRGSSPEEQMFAAQSGLMAHLIEDVSSDRLHCAGSLQTSFDLLGELGKGNPDVIRLLVNDLDEESFRKLMSVAAANLVDSNVFIRSLLLSLERLAAADRFVPLYVDPNAVDNILPNWQSQSGPLSRAYLTHSWWDAESISLLDPPTETVDEEQSHDEGRPADWFPTNNLIDAYGAPTLHAAVLPSGLEESVGHFGWLFSPGGDSLTSNTYLPNSVERLSWFLAANQARLLRDLLGVVDLRNINHENICCLNTAVVIAIFAHRRRQLPALLEELRQMNDEEKESKRRAVAAAREDDVVDRAFVQAMRYLDLGNQRDTPTYSRRRSLTSSISSTALGGGPGGNSAVQHIGDRADVMRNFREVLWFWTEYYTHRGRDRLSLEFSSHIRFQEWNHVVSLLSADDESATSLVRSNLRLPRSPYQRAARISDSPVRGL